MLSILSFSLTWVAPSLRPAQVGAGRAPRAFLQAAAVDLEALGVKGLPIEKTVRGFQMFADQKLKYQQLLFLAKKLPDMDEDLCIDERRVPGCLSTVYVHATRDDDGLISFKGTSDAQLTKGLVAMLVNGLSGCTNEQIQGVQPAFIQATGLEQSLTPGRNNVCSNASQLPSDLHKYATNFSPWLLATSSLMFPLCACPCHAHVSRGF